MDPEMRNTGNANGKRVRKPNTRFLNAPYVLGVSKRRKAEENVGNDELSRKSSIEQTNDGEPNAEKTAANSQNESVEQLDESSRGSCVKGTNGNELIVDETAESVKNIPTEHSVVNNTEASLKQVLEAVKSLTAEIETLKKQREEDRRLIDANSDKIKKLEDQVDKLKKCNNCNEIHKENTDLWCPECIKKEVRKKGQEVGNTIINKVTAVIKTLSDTVNNKYPSPSHSDEEQETRRIAKRE